MPRQTLHSWLASYEAEWAAGQVASTELVSASNPCRGQGRVAGVAAIPAQSGPCRNGAPGACYRVLALRYPRIIGTAHTTTIPTDHSAIPIAEVSTGPPSDNPRMASTA